MLVCVHVSPHFPWHVWFHPSLYDFLSPLPVSCRYFIQISTHMCIHTHTQIQTHTSVWGCELQDSTTSFDQMSSPSSVCWLFVWQPALLSDPLSGSWGASEAASLVHEWTVESAGVPLKNNPSLKNTAASLLIHDVLTVSVSSSNSGTLGQWGLNRQGGGGDCDTTAIKDLRGTGFCMRSGDRYGVRM